jgi:hypothetical protein
MDRSSVPALAVLAPFVHWAFNVADQSFVARKIARLKRAWGKFRKLPAGKRFQIHHEEAQRKDRARPPWLRVLEWLLIPLFIAIGIVLAFIPGPAILFFFLAAGLLASHSRWIARAFDRAELGIRSGWSAFQSRRKAR